MTDVCCIAGFAFLTGCRCVRHAGYVTTGAPCMAGGFHGKYFVHTSPNLHLAGNMHRRCGVARRQPQRVRVVHSIGAQLGPEQALVCREALLRPAIVILNRHCLLQVGGVGPCKLRLPERLHRHHARHVPAGAPPLHRLLQFHCGVNLSTK